MRHAEIWDVQALKALWKACFGDTDTYIKVFFEDLFRPTDCVLLEEDGKICTMAALIPQQLRVNGGQIPVMYLYAMCTHPDCRGKGYAQQLLNFAAYYSKTLGAKAITLVPAEESLFGFYAKAGYETAFYNKELEPPFYGMPPANGYVLPVTEKKYIEIRRNALAGRPYLDYDERYIVHQYHNCILAQGGLLRLDMPGGTGCCAVEQGDDDVRYLRELVVPAGMEMQALSLLMMGPRAHRMIARVPANAKEHGAKPFAMIHWLTEDIPDMEGAYLGLPLD